MHHGVFIGKHAAEQKKRVLILAESHHIDKKSDSKDKMPGVPATYTTESVIRNTYYDNPEDKYLKMFDKIVKSFGINPTEREAFWESVYFGNYIDVLCGVGDSLASVTVRQGDNRKQYNNELFAFIKHHEIDAVFCFSRLVYSNLPSFSKQKYICSQEHLETIACGTIGKGRDFIERCKYLANTQHNATDVLLHKDLLVFGMRHPSARGGFEPSHYMEFLKAELAKLR